MQVLLILLLTIFAAPLARAGDGHMTGNLPEYHVSSPGAAIVTAKNLLASEIFWPYQVEVVKDVKPAAPAPILPAGSVGVLIRVEASGFARVDFGRDGLLDVSVASTDLLARANRIRMGELEKMAPNFVFAIGPRLADSSGPSLRALPFVSMNGIRGYLCVFADPSAKDFSALAAALAPLRERDGVMTILFPQGRVPDVQLLEQLHVANWSVPFAYDHMSEPYTHTLLPADLEPPAVMLQTPEGRVIYASSWSPTAVAKLTGALDRAFSTVAASRTTSTPK
jgi:hypothetical protein